MKTAIINIKTDPQTKKKAQKIAGDLGLSLGSIVNALLREFVRNKRLDVAMEEPSEYMIRSLKESEEDVKAGRVHSFKNPKDALAFLDDVIERGYAG